MTQVPGLPTALAVEESEFIAESRSAVPDVPEGTAASPVARQWSALVQQVATHHSNERVSSGLIITELLDKQDRGAAFEGIPPYLDERLRTQISGLGPMRTAAEHMAVAASMWDAALLPELISRQVIVALAMDPSVGRPLLESGVLTRLVEQPQVEGWQREAPNRNVNAPPLRPGVRQLPQTLDRVVWDLLSSNGRELADSQPLLAAALGAPAEWGVRSPAEVTAVAWAPSGDRLAFLAGGTVYEAARDGPIRRVGVPDGRVASLAWGSDGVVALCVKEGKAELVLVADGTRLGEQISVREGLLSGDGTTAWLLAGDRLVRWTPGGQPPDVPRGPAAVPLAVNWAGSHALVDWEKATLLLTDGLTGPPPVPPPVKNWPPSGAQVVTTGPRIGRTGAFVALGHKTAVASARAEGGVALWYHPSPVVARIATGPKQVTALAADPAGTVLAVASGHQIRVWPLLLARPSANEVPGYDSDQVVRDDEESAPAPVRDLLDADRDARTLAALIASEQLRPPLAIGLFGAWGSGKSFVLNRIRRRLKEITTTARAEGYLRDIRVVSFNAWQYAEVNLWASLVDEVLRKIGPVAPRQDSAQVLEADKAAEDAKERAQEEARKAEDAERELQRVTRRRRLAWAAAACAGIVGTAVVAVAVLGAPARLAAGYGAAVALLTFASAAAAQIRRVTAKAGELKETGQDVAAAGAWVLQQVGTGAVENARQQLLRSRREYQVAQQEADKLREEADRVRELSVSQQLGAVLQRISALSEYRDQLSIVARTRDRFEEIDAAVSAARARRAEHPDAPPPQGDEPGLERVVVMIDDLDRCPPEKVVTVLEAVHLLFDFEMFVVLIAVDTRWLDQSLRIRYRHLLGKAGAAPSDYLEKIIQVPLHLRPLDEDHVRGMISGLTGASGPDGQAHLQPETVPHPEPEGSEADADPPAAAARLEATIPRPHRPPLPAEVLRISRDEAIAMSAVAPLIGTTPRTVKRYVNTYRLLKARARDVAAFDEPVGEIADHEIVAFLLALVTGHPALAAVLLPELAAPAPGGSLGTVIADLGAHGNTPGLADALACVRAWLAAHPRHAGIAASRFVAWAAEVSRFSFSPAALRQTDRAPAVTEDAPGR